jgi:hypothetical protein
MYRTVLPKDRVSNLRLSWNLQDYEWGAEMLLKLIHINLDLQHD